MLPSPEPVSQPALSWPPLIQYCLSSLSLTLEMIVRQPLALTGTETTYNISVHVRGGGEGGQASAVRLGIARALCMQDENMRSALKHAGFLTRDSRAKERKKPGLKRARKAPQYTKR